MKKMACIVLIALLAAVLLPAPVSAVSPVLKGEVTAVDTTAGTITILTNRDQSVLITPPADFDLSGLSVGEMVIAKGEAHEDGSFTAEWVRITGKDSDESKHEGGRKNNGAFCNQGKKAEPHPLALKMADEYGVDAGWVSGYYCDGYSMGAILLALKTAEKAGLSADDILASRASGLGWGRIWQDEGLIGSEKDIEAPPGQLKKPQ
jgi:hypothetical protein